MHTRFLVTLAALAAISGPVAAQPRRASIMGGGDRDRGKCTVEVVVDMVAEVEIRGDSAMLRTISGQPAQWRRFECNAPMPANPAGFRFAGVDGRGNQQLVREPRNGSPAVIRIEDPKSGSEGYTFDIFWVNGGFGGGPDRVPDRGPGPDRGYDRPPQREGDGYYRDRDDWFRGANWRGQLFQRVREDLEYVQAASFPGGGDEYRIVRTRQNLDDLQRKLADRRYDERGLDEVIMSLQRVVRDNRLSPRNRDMLADDVERLRDFRARHDAYGARDPR